MIHYFIVMATAGAACPLWGYALSRLDDAYDLSNRAAIAAVVASGLIVGAIVATVSAVTA